MKVNVDKTIEFVGNYLKVYGILVALSYLTSLKFYHVIFGSYTISALIGSIKVALGVTLFMLGKSVIYRRNQARLIVILICFGLGLLSIYCFITLDNTPSILPAFFYSVPIVILLLPKISKEFTK